MEGGRCLVVSLLYLLFQRALAVAALRLRTQEFKELEIVVLRHELAVLRRQIARPQLDDKDRMFRGCGQPAAEQRELAVVLHSSGHAAGLASPARRARRSTSPRSYNTHRPHRALGLRPPTPRNRLHVVGANPRDQIRRRDRLGGLIHECARAA
jgi:hypothetical protein